MVDILGKIENVVLNGTYKTWDFSRKVSVHFGAHDICEEDWISTQLVRPSRFKIHPGYNPKTDDNDVALLFLKRDINFGPKVV